MVGSGEDDDVVGVGVRPFVERSAAGDQAKHWTIGVAVDELGREVGLVEALYAVDREHRRRTVGAGDLDGVVAMQLADGPPDFESMWPTITAGPRAPGRGE